MRSYSKKSGRSIQSNYGHTHDDRGQKSALAAVRPVEPLRELGKDETGFYPLDEYACDAWTKHRGLTLWVLH